MYQRLILEGNLGADPEMRYTEKGTAMTRFPVATNEGSRDNEITIWWNITVFAKQAEACNQYLKKGRTVLIEGRLNPDKTTGSPRVYQKNDGSYGSAYDVTADRVRFVSRSDGGGGGYNEPQQEPEEVDDIPF